MGAIIPHIPSCFFTEEALLVISKLFFVNYRVFLHREDISNINGAYWPFGADAISVEYQGYFKLLLPYEVLFFSVNYTMQKHIIDISNVNGAYWPFGADAISVENQGYSKLLILHEDLLIVKNYQISFSANQ